MVCYVVCMIGIPNFVSLSSSAMLLVLVRDRSIGDGDSGVGFLWFI